MRQITLRVIRVKGVRKDKFALIGVRILPSRAMLIASISSENNSKLIKLNQPTFSGDLLSPRKSAREL